MTFTHLALCLLCESCGEHYRWRIGCTVNVFICNYHVMKKALARPEFADRPEYFTYAALADGNRKGEGVMAGGYNGGISM